MLRVFYRNNKNNKKQIATMLEVWDLSHKEVVSYYFKVASNRHIHRDSLPLNHTPRTARAINKSGCLLFVSLFLKLSINPDPPVIGGYELGP